MEIRLVSSMDKRVQNFVFTERKTTSHIFNEVMSNTDYEVWLRARNYEYKCPYFYMYYGYCYPGLRYKSLVKEEWTKIKVRTVAGICGIITVFINLFSFLHWRSICKNAYKCFLSLVI